MPAPSPDGRVIRFVDAGGVRLRTSVRGAGDPLLLITGLGASLDLGVPFERELAARGVQVVSFDAPGVGESAPYRWPKRNRITWMPLSLPVVPLFEAANGGTAWAWLSG